MNDIQQLRKGSTDLLILSILQAEPKYGYQIMQEIKQDSNGYFDMTAALLYPALKRLETDGMVTSEWQVATGKRERKYYEITDQGRKTLTKRRGDWITFVQNLFQTLQLPHPQTI